MGKKRRDLIFFYVKTGERQVHRCASIQWACTRLAMVGFVSAIGVELAEGDGLMAQLANGGLSWFFYTTVLLSVASLVPLFSGESPQSKTDGLMTSDAELWNGRLAMLGLVALAFTEYLKGGVLV